VADTHVALEASNALRVKDVADHAVGLDLVEATARAAGDDTGSILATVASQYCVRGGGGKSSTHGEIRSADRDARVGGSAQPRAERSPSIARVKRECTYLC